MLFSCMYTYSAVDTHALGYTVSRAECREKGKHNDSEVFHGAKLAQSLRQVDDKRLNTLVDIPGLLHIMVHLYPSSTPNPGLPVGHSHPHNDDRPLYPPTHTRTKIPEQSRRSKNWVLASLGMQSTCSPHSTPCNAAIRQVVEIA